MLWVLIPLYLSIRCCSHQKIAYIFSGSEQSVIRAMLRDHKRAFYKLGRIMELGPIDRKSWKEVIILLTVSCPIGLIQ